MLYDDARVHIRTGDLIAVRSVHSILTRLTQIVTRSPYTHIGVAIWLDGGLWMAELNGGRNHIIPMSQLRDTAFDVYKCPISEAAAREAILESLRVMVPYSPLAFLVIGFLDLFKIEIFVHWRKILVCSGYASKIYDIGKWGEHSYILSPRAIAALLDFRLSVN